MTMKRKEYIIPESVLIEVEYHLMKDQASVADGGDEPGQTDDNWARGNSFFDDEEFDDGFLNGGPNMFTDWEDKDRL